MINIHKKKVVPSFIVWGPTTTGGSDQAALVVVSASMRKQNPGFFLGLTLNGTGNKDGFLLEPSALTGTTPVATAESCAVVTEYSIG